MTAALESRFDVPGTDGLTDQLEQIASKLAAEYWDEYQKDIIRIVDGSFLEGYDAFSISAAFRNAASVSIAYTLMSRCGHSPPHTNNCFYIRHWAMRRRSSSTCRY